MDIILLCNTCYLHLAPHLMAGEQNLPRLFVQPIQDNKEDIVSFFLSELVQNNLNGILLCLVMELS